MPKLMTKVNGAGGAERETEKRSCNQLKERRQVQSVVDNRLLCSEQKVVCVNKLYYEGIEIAAPNPHCG